MQTSRTIEDVKAFWDANPLWSGESSHQPGSKAFFEEHARVYVNDCFAGKLDPRVFPMEARQEPVLDLGCGTGFWLAEFGRRGFQDIVGADISPKSLALARLRCELNGVDVTLREENAEQTSFPDACFQHVNCLGVIHHTTRPDRAMREIQRVLRPGGTAVISVYYKSVMLRFWPVFRPFARLLFALGARMKGRGRERIFAESDVNELVRLYDGRDNPIGIAFSRSELLALIGDGFEAQSLYHHFFPARSLPFHIPRWLHRVLDRRLPLMIFANLRKRPPSAE